MTPKEISERIALLTCDAEYDGAIILRKRELPYKYVSKKEAKWYHDKWVSMENNINQGIKEYIEEYDKKVNPQRKYVSSDWWPIAHFNGGSDIYAIILRGKYSGYVVGILSDPYAVLTIASSIDKFHKMGKSGLSKIG